MEFLAGATLKCGYLYKRSACKTQARCKQLSQLNTVLTAEGSSAAAPAGDYRREWRKRYFQILTGDVPRIQYYRDFSVSACSSAGLHNSRSTSLHTLLPSCKRAGLHNSSTVAHKRQHCTVCQNTIAVDFVDLEHLPLSASPLARQRWHLELT